MFIPPLVRPVSRPGSSFYPQARRGRAVRLQTGRINHDGPGFCLPGRQALHHPGEDPHGSPTFPAVTERLVRTILSRSILPTQAVPIDEDDATQHTAVIHPRPAVALRKKGRKCAIRTAANRVRMFRQTGSLAP